MFVRNGRVTGSVYKAGLVTAGADPSAEHEDIDFSEPQILEPSAEERPDGVHAVGGGWHEVVIDGEVIDKVRGADAAQEAYEAYQQSNPDEE